MRLSIAVLCFSATLVATGCAGSNVAGPLPQNGAVPSSGQRTLSVPLGAKSIVPATAGTSTVASLCAKPIDPSHATCFSSYRVDSSLTSLFPDAVAGLTPSDLGALYAYPAPGFQGSLGSASTVGIVVAYDYASAESDLAIYRAQFGLPPCTSANGCLKKVGAAATGTVSPTGTGTSVSANPTSVSANPTTPLALGWAAETDIDLDIISAVCPNCKIVLAEAATDSLSDLSAAASAAISRNATYVSESFGSPEQSADVGYSALYANPAVRFFAAAGDGGYGVSYPASDPNVIAVGGTSLAVVGMYLNETVWSGTGSGCSGYFNKPAWQHTPSGCTSRNVADVGAVADPLTGVAIYNSSLPTTGSGWFIFGGTSISTPIIAGISALANRDGSTYGAQTLYANPGQFYRITGGSNGSCTYSYLCHASEKNAYNGPTGIGVPQGLGGF